jgi:suppressor for copper-sensitivity B
MNSRNVNLSNKINFMQVRKIIFTILLLFSYNLKAASTEFYSNSNESAKVAILSTFTKENNLIIAVHFKIEKGWHIYSPNKDKSYQEPKFNFTGSENIDNNNYDILWPKAVIKSEKFDDTIYQYSAYQDEIIIPIRLHVIDKNKDIKINLEIDYSICNKVCVPAKNTLSTYIKKNSIDYDLLSKITKLSNEIGDTFNYKYFLKIIIFAFIGGLILNIMPCVLPVLSIKLISITKHKNLKESQVKKMYFATILGIIFTFLILALLTTLLRELGSSFGWGLQFQNPYFLITTSIILTIFISNLFGNFDINFNFNLTSGLNQKITEKEKKRNIFISNFLSGILAVLLATPCSAPFLGTSISFALTQDVSTILIIFFAISVGFSFPYFALILSPHSIKLLPRSGSWTIIVKYTMCALLIMTLIWIIYIILSNIGLASSALIVLLLISILTFLKLSNKKIKHPKRLLILLLLSAITLIFPIKLQNKIEYSENNSKKLWAKFDQNLIEKYINQNKIILIDITADWCITCKVNKLIVLDNQQITDKIKSGEIIAMRGDMTKTNQKLLDFMANYNRYAIPFNIVYGPNAKDGILTSELLTMKSLLGIIKEASNK